MWLTKTGAAATLALLALTGCDGINTCRYEGKVYPIGQTFPSGDGCNTCSCSSGGAVACTLRACLLPDGGDAAVMCTGAPPSFPTFERRCAAPSDCFAAIHQINCCGSTRAIGVNAAEKARFQAAEQTCRSQYPGCDCAAAPTVAEDGKSSTTADGSDVAVDCRAGACQTYIR